MASEDSQDYSENFKDVKLSDSFGKDMDELYNNHKKDSQGPPFEIQNSQRPVSKYQRDRVGSAKQDPSPGDDILDESAFIDRLNSYLISNQITQSDFCDNVNLLLSKEDVKEIFKRIRFVISTKELNYIFNNNNPNKDDDYIYCFTLFKQNKLTFYSTKTEISKTSSVNQSESSLNGNGVRALNNKKETEHQMKQINAEFDSFKLDILKIVETENKKDRANLQSANLAKVKVTNKQATNNKLNNIKKPNKEDPRLEQAGPEERKVHEKKKPNYLMQTLNKKMMEEDMNRLAIEKKNKEFQRDCVRKMVLANEYAEVLQIPKSYSAYAEEQDNNLACRVYDKNSKDYMDIDLKQFLIEFKKLQKTISQNEARKKYKEADTTQNEHEHDNEFFKKSRKERHKIISDILKESLELKVLLTKQLKALRDKNLIDGSIINKNLKLTNLDK